ncbi:hypothetical protein A2U01_0097368, partial [Trifolium medium]|nr:hypothetical protein [Trifolium medium]
MQKTLHVIQRHCHLPTRHMEVAGLHVPSLNKSGQQTGIKEYPVLASPYNPVAFKASSHHFK